MACKRGNVTEVQGDTVTSAQGLSLWSVGRGSRPRFYGLRHYGGLTRGTEWPRDLCL